MLQFVKRHWVVIAIVLLGVLYITHKNCAGCQKRFSSIKDKMNPLNSDIITGFGGV